MTTFKGVISTIENAMAITPSRVRPNPISAIVIRTSLAKRASSSLVMTVRGPGWQFLATIPAVRLLKVSTGTYVP